MLCVLKVKLCVSFFGTKSRESRLYLFLIVVCWDVGFGASISLYGDTTLIGTERADDNGKIFSGSVYLFTRSSADGAFMEYAILNASLATRPAGDFMRHNEEVDKITEDFARQRLATVEAVGESLEEQAKLI